MYGEIPHMVESLRSLSLTSVKRERRPRVDSLTSDGKIRSCVTTNPQCTFCFVTQSGSINRTAHAWPHSRNLKISTHHHVTWAEMKNKIRKLGWDNSQTELHLWTSPSMIKVFNKKMQSATFATKSSFVFTRLPEWLVRRKPRVFLNSNSGFGQM